VHVIIQQTKIMQT